MIFDRFQQEDSETSRKYGGTGLGLAIVNRLVEIQGGIIGVESEKGKGSTFSFSIPYKKASSEIAKQLIVEEKGITKETLKMIKILVAEDNVLNRKLIDAIFSDWGFNFEFAENGKQAIEKLEKSKFDMVLMDIQMPAEMHFSFSPASACAVIATIGICKFNFSRTILAASYPLISGI